MERKRRLIALILSTVIVGAGQIYRRRYITGIIFLLIAVSSVLFFRIVWTGFNYWFIGVIFSWIVLWIVNIIDAYKGPFYETAPCEDACPAGIKVLDYVLLIAENRFEEAYKTIVEKTPFIATLGRVCPAPCEDKCSRSGIDSSIAIRYLKRIVSQKEILPLHFVQGQNDRLGKKVGIIGGGPCGLTCAYELVQKGYQVSVFEKDSEPGGMLTQCIPEYRLPKDITIEEINLIEKAGVEIKRNTEIGKDILFKDIEAKFDAIFIATGANISYKLNIPGEELEGIHYGIEFLKSVKGHETSLATPIGVVITTGAKVVVVGGGNVAIDAAQVAKRLGAPDVHIVCLESRKEMPAFESEIKRAIEEQIEIHPSLGVSKIVGQGCVSRIELISCASVFDTEGKFAPVFDKALKTSIDCDTVIIAIGQRPDLGFIPDRLADRIQSSRLKASGFKVQRLDRGIFVGGDVITGPATVVSAIQAGKQGAKFIDLSLRGWSAHQHPDLSGHWKARLDDWLEFYERPPIGKIDNAAWSEKKPTSRPRIEIPLVTDRSNFAEVEINCREEQAVKEAKRCLRCPHRISW